MSDNRRKAPRYVVDLPAELLIGETAHAARVQDICRDAALVRSDCPCGLGTGLVLVMELPMGEPIRVEGKVIRQAGSQEGEHAFAVLFSGHDPAAATEIEIFLSHVEAGHFA